MTAVFRNLYLKLAVAVPFMVILLRSLQELVPETDSNLSFCSNIVPGAGTGTRRVVLQHGVQEVL
jgi:hypothetical protein